MIMLDGTDITSILEEKNTVKIVIVYYYICTLECTFWVPLFGRLNVQNS